MWIAHAGEERNLTCFACESMSLSIHNTLLRLKPWAKTAFTVGLYMGFGDLLTQKIALRRKKL